MMMEKKIFTEEQSFRNTWIIYPVHLVSVSAVGVMAYGMIRQLVNDQPWGNNPMPDSGLIVTFIFVTLVMVGVQVLFQLATLKTEITGEGIYYTFPPFINRKKFIPRADIEEYEIRKYKPIMEYGGWGIRVGLGRGKAYNVWGNIGIQLHLKNNKKLLLGTQKKDQANWAMEKMMKKET